jgi:hypothetical protein
LRFLSVLAIEVTLELGVVHCQALIVTRLLSFVNSHDRFVMRPCHSSALLLATARIRG